MENCDPPPLPGLGLAGGGEDRVEIRIQLAPFIDGGPVEADFPRGGSYGDSGKQEFGDLLLSSVAARLQNSLGKQLTVARIGGDIFCVLGDAGQVNPANILTQFSTPFSNFSFCLSASL